VEECRLHLEGYPNRLRSIRSMGPCPFPRLELKVTLHYLEANMLARVLSLKSGYTFVQEFEISASHDVQLVSSWMAS
jgi:hypothetical protein